MRVGRSFLDTEMIPRVSLCLLLSLAATVASHAAEVKVFLMGGQSNMLGRAPLSGLPPALQSPQADVLFFGGSDGTVGTTLTTLRPDGKNATEFGPEVTFGRSIADASPTTQYALIKYAAGGTALYNDWAPGTGAQYTAFRDTVAAGLAALHAAGHTTEIVGMAWHQGESDAIEGRQASYASNLTAFIADIRSRYGAGLPFLIGEIRRSNGAAFVTVADAQVAVASADPNAVFVPASDLSFLDTYHFDAASQITLGERFAAAYAGLLAGGGDAAPPALNPGSIVDDKGGAAISPGTTVTYTLTFSEDLDETTVGAADFDNAGTAAITIGAITESSPGVLTVKAKADTAGTLQLRIPTGASITDVAGNPLDCDPPITDDTTLTVSTAASPWIQGVSINSVSSTFSAARSAENMINGNGFTEASGFHSSAGGDNISWTSASSGATPLPHSVTFDLGSGYDLGSVKIWNWNTSGTLTAGCKDIDILVADHIGGPFSYLGSFVLAMAPGQGNADFGQTIDLGGLAAAGNARLLRIEIKSNHGFSNGLSGLSEVRFSGTAIPAKTFLAYISDPAFGLDPEDHGFDADPDGDHIPNGLEAWFGTHPGEPDTGLSGITTDGTTSTFTHPQNGTPVGNLSGFYEWSGNLIDWYAGDGVDGAPLGPTVTISSQTLNGTTTVTATASGKIVTIFFRVGAVQE